MKKRIIEAIVIIAALAAVFAVINGIASGYEKRTEQRGSITIDGVDYYKDEEKLELLLLKGEGFERLSEMTGLRELTLKPYVTQLTPDGYKENAALYDTYTRVDDISCLSGLDIRYLSLENCGVSDIACLSRMKNLNTLVLSGTEVTDISVIKSLPSLKKLSINGCVIGDYTPLYESLSLEEVVVDERQSVKVRDGVKVSVKENSDEENYYLNMLKSMK